MTLKEFLLECHQKYYAPPDENLEPYEKILHSQVYSSENEAKVLVFQRYLTAHAPEEKLKEFAKSTVSAKKYEELIKISEKEKKPFFDTYSTYTLLNLIPDHVDELCGLLTSEQQEEVRALAEKERDPYFWSDEQIDKPALTQEINEIKAQLSPAELKKYSDVLDYAEKATFEHKGYDFQKLLSAEVNKEAERIFSQITKDTVNQKYSDIVAYKTDTATLRDNPDSSKVKELKDEQFIISDRYKNTLKEAFDIFSEMEKDSNDSVSINEQGDKFYGFFAYGVARKKLFDAVKSKNIEEIDKCVKQHQKAMQQLDKLAEITKQFDPNKLAFVGNIDVSRNSSIPAKYIKDMPLSSKINTAYMLYAAMKESGKSVDEFFEKPESAIDSLINKDINEIGLNLRIKGSDNTGKSISEVLTQFNGIGNNITKQEQLRSIYSYGTMRSLNALYTLEPDQENKEKLMRANARLEIKVDLAQRVEERNRTLFLTGDGAELKSNDCSDLLANYFLFDDKERDYNLLNSKDGYTDPMTFEYVPPFDRTKFLKENEIDIKAVNSRILDTIDKMVVNPLKKSKSPFTSKKVIKSAIQTLANDIIKEKSALAGTPEYEKLKNFANDPVKEYDNTRTNDLEITKNDYETFEKNLIKEEKAFNKKFAKAKGDEKEALKQERLNALKESFSRGDIPAKYFIERSRQIVHENFGKLPPLFEADKFPSLKNYVKEMHLEDLTPEERQQTYDSAKERATFEKQQFIEDRARTKEGIPVERDDPDELLRMAGIEKYATEAEAIGKDAMEYRERINIKELDDVQNNIQEVNNSEINKDDPTKTIPLENIPQ